MRINKKLILVVAAVIVGYYLYKKWKEKGTARG